MVGWHELRELPRFSMFYRATLLTTLALTVVFDLTVAVQVGLVLSCLFFIYRMSSLTTVEPIALAPEQAALPGGGRVEAWSLFGSVFFGSVTKIQALHDPAKDAAQLVILEMHKVIYIDNTGLDALEGLQRSLARRDAHLVLVDLNEQPRQMLARAGFLDGLGPGGVFPDLQSALAMAHVKS